MPCNQGLDRIKVIPGERMNVTDVFFDDAPVTWCAPRIYSMICTLDLEDFYVQ